VIAARVPVYNQGTIAANYLSPLIVERHWGSIRFFARKGIQSLMRQSLTMLPLTSPLLTSSQRPVSRFGLSIGTLLIVAFSFVLAGCLIGDQRGVAQEPAKKLPVTGEVFRVEEREAFLIPAKGAFREASKPWVWYAPTLPNLPGPEERWMFERFQQAGIAVGGIDAGESYGSPDGNRVFDLFYAEMIRLGYSSKPVLLGRSRGGLQTLSWAISRPTQVAAWAGIYPVCSLASYPGIERAAGAYQLTPDELRAKLSSFNPVDRIDVLAKAKVPLFAIHGDVDQVVPLEANSGAVQAHYKKLGAPMELVIPPGQGHNMWEGFFQCKELVDFVIKNAQ
jgi:fermentation-respiration switch protein FrsA (DUF1100 family)